MAYVIAITGAVGSGKTTYAHALGAALGNAAVLDFDWYERASNRPLPQLDEWLQAGGDFNAFSEPLLVEELMAMRADKASAPVKGFPPGPNEFICLALPLGRQDRALAPLLDFMVWVEVPRDVALARKLRQFLDKPIPGQAPAQQLAWLDQYLEGYGQLVHRVLARQAEVVRPEADLEVDGTLPVEENVARLVAEVRRRAAGK